MTKPYMVCYMMTSVDGRIDCEIATTQHLFHRLLLGFFLQQFLFHLRDERQGAV